MQIKSIKEIIKPNYPTNNERKNNLLKFIFNNKKITISLALICLLSKTTFATIQVPSIDSTLIAGGIPTYHRTFSVIQWSFFLLGIAFCIYELLFNLINLKKYNSLDTEGQKKFKKRRVKTFIIKISVCLLLFITLGILNNILY